MAKHVRPPFVGQRVQYMYHGRALSFEIVNVDPERGHIWVLPLHRQKGGPQRWHRDPWMKAMISRGAEELPVRWRSARARICA